MSQLIPGLKIGLMSDLITIVRRTSFTDDYGQVVNIPDGNASTQVWACITPLTGSEVTEGRQVVNKAVYQCTVRFEADDQIKGTNTVVWDNKEYDIEMVHVLGRKQYWRFNILSKDNGVVN
jgi:head-tail adaptor